MNKTFSKPVLFIQLISLVLDISAFILGHALTSLLIEPRGADLFADFKPHAITYALGVGVICAFCISRQYSRRIPWWNKIQFSVKIVVAALLIEIVARGTILNDYIPLYSITYWTVSLCLLMTLRAGFYVIKIKIPSWKVPVALIGDVGTVTDILYAISGDLGIGYDPQYALIRDKESNVLNHDDIPPLYKDINFLDGQIDYSKFIKRHPDLHYIISMDTFRGEKRDRLLRLLKDNNIEFSLVPMISQISLHQAKPLYFFGNDVMLLETKRNKLSLFQKTLQRCVDIIGSSLGLAIFCIPILIITILLKLENRDEPVFYGGRRVGQNGETFKCWKFRTMESNSDHLLTKYLEENPEEQAYWDKYFKLRHDPRVKTKTTKFIRKTSIDELPQLWNVFINEMSIVGPRPILPNEIEAYGPSIKDYTMLKPGITGLWQVSGRSETTFDRRVIWDSWYIRNWSFWGDMVIIIKTVMVVINRKGAT